MINLDQKQLQEKFTYDKNTGIFTNLVSCGNAKKGSIAGTKDSDGYLKIRISGKEYKSHRLAWLYIHGIFPCGMIDHINHNRSDNRIINLRDTTQAINQQNKISPSSNNKVGLLGVSFIRNSYLAAIRINGKQIYCGKHKTKELAHAAYLNAKAIYHPSSNVGVTNG